MKTSLIAVLTLMGATLAAPAFAQRGMGQGNGRGSHTPLLEFSLEQRLQLREERQQRRESLLQMPLEERRQLRQDIRDAGQTIYPLGRQGRRAQLPR